MINHQNNMVTQLHSLVPVSHEDVDTEETYQLINFTNGILDVTNGQLNPHDPKYLITMQVPYEYNPNAQCRSGISSG